MWELIFLMLVLKIPIVYLCCVVYWAIKAEPKPLEGALLPAVPEPTPEPPPCPWQRRRVRPRLPHPSGPRGGRVRRVHAPVPR
jgi:hypothetical protein